MNEFKVKLTEGPFPMEYGPSCFESENTILAKGTFRGLNFTIININNDHPSAYVSLPDDFGDDEELFADFSCHAGVNYVCYENDNLPKIDDHIWIGWSYDQYKDFCSYKLVNHFYKENMNYIKYTTDMIIDDCLSVINQYYEKYYLSI